MEAAARATYLDATQVHAIYEAATFLPQATGEMFNAFLEIEHREFEIVDESHASGLVSNLTKEISRTLARRRFDGVPGAMSYIAVMENLRGGLTTSLALRIPNGGLADARAVVERILVRQKSVPVDINEHFREWPCRMAAHWEIVRKLWRGIDPQIVIDQRPIAELLKIAEAARRPCGHIEGRRFSTSGDIGVRAQQAARDDKMAHISAWRYGRFDQLFTGWELAEYRERRHEIQMRDRQKGQIERQFDHLPMSAARERIAGALKLEASNRPDDPRARARRTAQGWWHSAE